MKLWQLWFILAVSARKLVDFNSPLRTRGIDLHGMEAMVLQLRNQSSTENLKPLLDQFRKLLFEEMLPSLQQEQGAANSLLDQAARGFESCHGVNSTRIWKLVAQHKQCRMEEFTIHAAVTLSCNASQSMQSQQQQKCKALEDLDVYPTEVPLVCNKDLRVDTSHEAHAKRVRDFYQSKVHALVNAQSLCEHSTNEMTRLKQGCQLATASLTVKSESCVSIQRSLDDLACEAWTAHYECDKRNSCLSQARHRYLDANSTGVSTERDLMSQWRAVKRIDCLLDAIERDLPVDACRQKTYDARSMALTYPFFQDQAPRMPDVSSCKRPLFQRPGSPGYVQEVYDLGPKASPSATCTAECCGRCEFFTCNSSTVLKPGAKTRFGFSQEVCCELPPKVQWKADAWPRTAVCSTECGLHAVHETRKVLCWDAANAVEMDPTFCSALKSPAAKRQRCAATASCQTCRMTSCPEGYVNKSTAPATCKGQRCTTEECCDQLCSAQVCPVGYSLMSPAPKCTNCTVASCCNPTSWKFEKWSDAKCDSSCGQREVIENRTVLCQAYPSEDPASAVTVGNEKCKGTMPPNYRVRCPATAPCRIHWDYPDWALTVDCAARACGMREVTEDRTVACKDQSGGFLPNTRCPGEKPSSHRVVCPATPSCNETTTAAPTTTTATAAKVGSWVAPAWSKADCSQRCCGLGELKEERAVLCMDCTGRLLPECSCAGPKPATSMVLCPATSPCGSPVAASTTATMTTVTTTQVGPSPVWVYTAWMTDRTNCSRGCGQGELVQERPVICKDLASGRELLEANCTGTKPSTRRTLCPATAPCVVKATSTSTTTTTPSSLTCCPKGFALKSLKDLPLSCQQGTCEVEQCCSKTRWVYDDWDETPECDQSCGRPEQTQERSVTCQAVYGGEVLSDDACGAPKPSGQRILCPATSGCTSCAGFVCGDDALPVLPVPACINGKCDSQQCCRKFLSGFHTQPDASVSTVANEGRQGGRLKFRGSAPQLSDGGHFFQLNGETSMDLLTPSVHNGFTALVYLRPHVEAWVDKEQVVLVQKGVDGSVLWNLALTPMKQFRISSFKDGESSCTCASVHEDHWSHVMVRDNKSSMDLVINGKSCCGTWSSVQSVSGGSTIWLEEGLKADLHSVEIWDTALNDREANSVTRRYNKAIPDWLPFQRLSCIDNEPINILTGIQSLAHCKLRCEKQQDCRSVLFEVASGRCVMRNRFAGKECTRNARSLSANYDAGCRKIGAFDWRLSVTLEKTVPVTELTFLDEDQHQIHADIMTDANFKALDPNCALSDWKTTGSGCAIPHGSGFWEYRFKKCVNPTYLVMAVKEGHLPDNFPVKIRYSTASGGWGECSARPVLWITSDHSDSALRRFHLTCFGPAPLAESPWWHH